MTHLIIRKALQTDAQFIAKGVLSALHIEENSMEHINNLAAISSRTDTLYSYCNSVIAEWDGVPVGLMVAYPGARYREMRDITFPLIRMYVGDNYSQMEDEALPGEYYLDSLSVLPEYRCRGIARALINEMFSIKRDAGIPLATILVDPGNTNAYSLYESCGFTHSGSVSVFGTTYDRLVCE